MSRPPFVPEPAIPTLVDLYDPFLVENLAYARQLGEGPFLHDHATLDAIIAHLEPRDFDRHIVVCPEGGQHPSLRPLPIINDDTQWRVLHHCAGPLHAPRRRWISPGSGSTLSRIPPSVEVTGRSASGVTMDIQRGDVLKARFPHAAGGRGKKRAVVVVQANTYNQRLRHAVVAEVTGNLADKGDPACVFLDGSTPDARTAGLTRDCLISCYLLTLISEDRLRERIGRLSDEMLARLDGCLKAALGLP